MRIATWNLERGGRTRAARRAQKEALRALERDVLVLTEPAPSFEATAGAVTSPRIRSDRSGYDRGRGRSLRYARYRDGGNGGMLVHTCANCGKPRPVALLPVQPPCRACGVNAPLAQHLEAAIDEARRAVLNLPLRAKQLRAVDLELLEVEGKSGSARSRWAFMAFVLALAFCFGMAAWIANPWERKDHRPDATLVVFAVPFPLHLMCGLALRRAMRLERERTRRELQARPGTEGTFECRVCGGPLTSGIETPVVGCDYCGAPNVLERHASATAADVELTSFDSLRDRVVASIRPTAMHIVVRWLLLVTPFLLFLLLIPAWKMADSRLRSGFRPDHTLMGRVDRSQDNENGRLLTRTCLSGNGKEPFPLASLIGVEVHSSYGDHRVTDVGTDGYGRTWLRMSQEGLWLTDSSYACWPVPDPHGERWKAEHPSGAR